MYQNFLVKYLDRVIAAFCAWYLYRFHVEPMMPGYSLRKHLKRISFIEAISRENDNRQVSNMDGAAKLFIAPDRPHANNEVFTKWLITEHVKAIANPDEVETIYIVFDNPVAK